MEDHPTKTNQFGCIPDQYFYYRTQKHFCFLSRIEKYLERIVRMHATLSPEKMSPANIHLVKHFQVLSSQLEVPDVEIGLNSTWCHRLQKIN